MKRSTVFIFILLMLFEYGTVGAQDFYAGAALRIITPDPLLPVSGGIGQPKPVNEKKGDLYARALVLKKGTTVLAIVSVDNLGWSAVLGDKSRSMIKGIPPENIMIGATHTHSAPDSYAFPDENGNVGADLRYLDWCSQQIADAVNEALGKIQPAAIRTAVGEAKGAIAYNYYAPDLYDPRCGVIQAVATTGPDKGKNIATLVNYASHPEIIGSNRGILSPDFCGPLYTRIESKAGGIALYLNSAQGGMVTADTRRPNGQEENSWEECIRIGVLLADEALRIISPAEFQSNPDLYCGSKTIRFPVESQVMKYILQNSPIKYPATKDGFISTRINIVNLGKAQILTIPGEALPNVGYYVKRKMNTGQPFLFGLTNDSFGYMIARVDYQSFRRYDYISRTCLGENTAEIYMEEALKLVKESPQPSVTATSADRR
jgi:hypothetical protein